MVRWFGLAGVTTLMVCSGVLSVLAARERWWPVCKLGAFDTAPCLARQDDAYDYLWIIEASSTVATSTEYAGAGLLLLAAAAAALPWVLLRVPLPTTTLLGVALALPPAVTACAMLSSASPAADSLLDVGTRVVEVVAALLWVVGWPTLLVMMTLRARPRTRTSRCGWVVMVAALVGTTPVPQMFFAVGILGYASYDTSPWSEATLAVLLLVAAVALWPAALGPVEEARGSDTGSPPTSRRFDQPVDGPSSGSWEGRSVWRSSVRCPSSGQG